jgi:hypothetical protein
VSKLDLLRPEARPCFDRFLDKLERQGLRYAVLETLRIREVNVEEIKTLSAGQETQEDTTMGGKGEGSSPAAGELLAKLDQSVNETAAFKKELADLKSAGAKKESEAFFSKLRDEGKLPPALFEKAVALDARLGEEERKEIRSLFSALETKVDLSGKHVVDKNTAAGAGDAALTAKIRSFQKEKGLASGLPRMAAVMNPWSFAKQNSEDETPHGCGVSSAQGIGAEIPQTCPQAPGACGLRSFWPRQKLRGTVCDAASRRSPSPRG